VRLRNHHRAQLKPKRRCKGGRVAVAALADQILLHLTSRGSRTVAAQYAWHDSISL